MIILSVMVWNMHSRGNRAKKAGLMKLDNEAGEESGRACIESRSGPCSPTYSKNQGRGDII